jgi:type II secretory pathway component GspD/PulD (secretin)
MRFPAQGFGSRLSAQTRSAGLFRPPLIGGCAWQLGRRLGFLVVTVAVLAGHRPLLAMPADVVGILSAAVEPAVAQQLELSEEQVAQLRELINERQREALGFADRLREVPLEDRDGRRRAYIRESELLGYRLLSFGQREMLERIRLARLGLSSLAESDVAAAVGLSQGQQQAVIEIVSERPQMVRKLGESEANSEIEKKLRQLLTGVQLATWQQMSGIGGRAASAASPSDADRQLDGKADDDSKADDDGQGDEAQGDEAQGDEAQGDEDGDWNAEAGDAGDQWPEGTQPDLDQQIASLLQQLPGEPQLLINFRNTAWEQVLGWLAEEGQLSLQIDQYPPGTFTYQDPYRPYTIPQTLDVMNSVLLGKGYTLILRQRILMVVDLTAGDDAEVTRGLLRELAQLVSVDEIEQRGDFEILKVLFNLTRMTPEEGQEEILPLLGPHGSAVALPTSRQVLVTETGAKLKLISRMLRKIEEPDQVTRHELKHISTEEVLAVARPLLGLADSTNVSDQIKISADPIGGVLYVSGSPDRTDLLKAVIKSMDVDPQVERGASAAAAPMIHRSYQVTNISAQMAYDILQTMLEGTSRLYMGVDEASSKIVAWGTDESHGIITGVLDELAGGGRRRELIPLGGLDPAAVVTTLERFFGKPPTGEAAVSYKGLNFVVDTPNRTLVVQGNSGDIQEVKQLISELSSANLGGGFGDRVRTLPLTGASADRLLEQMELLWGQTERPNRIRVVTPATGAARNDGSGRVPAGQRRREPSSVPPTNQARRESGAATAGGAASDLPAAASDEAASGDETGDEQSEQTQVAEPIAASRPEVTFRPPAASESMPLIDAGQGVVRPRLASAPWVATVRPLEGEPQPPSAGDEPKRPGRGESDIVIMRGPTGLIVTSDDPQALEEFDRLARLLGEQMAASQSEPTVFYLKYIEAPAAEELLTAILGGASASGGSGGLDMAAGLLGGFFGLGGGSSSNTISTLSGSEVSITAEPRLNALIVQGSVADIEYIDQLLKILDTEDSMTEIETAGRPRLIQLQYKNVSEVEAIVKQVFADRIAQPGQAGGARQPSPQDLIQALAQGMRGGRGGRSGGGGGGSQLKKANMTVSSDAKSNTLIVSASAKLFEEVEEFVQMLDGSSEDVEEVSQVVSLGGNVNPQVVQSALQALYGQQARTSGTTTRDTRTTTQTGRTQPPSGAGSGQPTFDFNALRQQMMQRQGGGGTSGMGGGRTGGFPGGFGGTPQRGGTTRGGTGRGR